MGKIYHSPFNLAVIVAGLGFFVDAFDLFLFNVYRIPSLKDLGLTADNNGSVLQNIANFQTSRLGTDNAKYLAATQDLDTFALRFKSNITVFEEGDYTFYSRSDAGSQLYIDGALVIDNDGLHSARTLYKTVHLTKGVHNIVETYFEQTGAQVNDFGLYVYAQNFAGNIELDGSRKQYTINIPALPVDAIVQSTEIQLQDAIALNKSWQDEIKIALSGSVNLAATTISELEKAGLIKPNPYSVITPNMPKTGGNLTLSIFDNYNDPGVDATIKNAQVIITYKRDELTSLRPQSSAQDQKSWQIYDAAHRVIANINAVGSLTRYEYDGDNQLIKTTAYANAIDTSQLGKNPSLQNLNITNSVDDRVTRYFYDDDGLLIGTLDAAGYLSEQKYDASKQRVTTIHYANITDSALRNTDQLDQLRPSARNQDQVSTTLFNARGQIIAQIDAENYLSEFQYDSVGKQTQSIRYQNKIDILILQKSSDDGIGTLNSIRPTRSAEDQIQNWQYDLLGQLSNSTNSEGTQTKYEYDEVGRLIRTNLASNSDQARTQTQRYDLQGRLIAELSAIGAEKLAALNNPSTQDIENIWQQYSVHYQYDQVGRKLCSTDANGNKTLYYSNEDGQILYTINALGEVSGYQYNALNQLTGSTRYATRINVNQLSKMSGGLLRFNESLNITASAEDSHTEIIYQNDGRIQKSINALAYDTSNQYNAFGEQIAIQQSIDQQTQRLQKFNYDQRGLQTEQTLSGSDHPAHQLKTQQVYDAFGRVVESIDANGNHKQFEYDRLGRQIQLTNALGYHQQISYDAMGRILKQTDALGNTITTQYNTQARSSTLTTAEGISITTVHNVHGQTQTIIDGNGKQTQYQYDANGNLIQTNTALTQTQQHFDRANRLIESIDAKGAITRIEYDAANRVIKRTQDASGLAISQTYTYDAKGQLIQNTDGNGIQTIYRYDLKGQLVQSTLDPQGLAISNYIEEKFGGIPGYISELIIGLKQGQPIEEYVQNEPYHKAKVKAFDEVRPNKTDKEFQAIISNLKESDKLNRKDR